MRFFPAILLAPAILFCSVATASGVSGNVILPNVRAAIEMPTRLPGDFERDPTSKPAEVLSFFGVAPGMTVADLLSGGGYYSELLAHAVGDSGHVVAQNNRGYEIYLPDAIKARYANNRLPKVEQLVSEFDDLKLGEARFDLIIIIKSYHDIYWVSEEYAWPKVDRDLFFKQLVTALKPGGVLGIVDHAALAGTGKKVAQTLHRIEKSFAIKDIEQAGLVYEGSINVLRDPNDPRTVSAIDESMKARTDRFVIKFSKPR